MAARSGFPATTTRREASSRTRSSPKKRAFAVRDQLKSAGVAEDRIDMAKPELTQGSGDNAEARRVEIVILK